MTALAKLPPLPDTELLTTLGRDAYTDQQMRDYARAAIAALSPAELGGVACATCCRVDQADAWEAVFDTLQEIRPDFVPAGVTAMDASCALIRELSTPRAAEAVTEWHWIRIGDWGEIVQSMPTGDDTYATGYQDALNAVTRKLCSLPQPALTPPSAKGG